MKKAGRRLFQRLGALRDVQVMMEWWRSSIKRKLKWLQVWRWATLRFAQGRLACVRQSQLTPDSIPDTADQAAKLARNPARREQNNSMKRNPLSKNSTANSGASGVSLFPHGPPASAGQRSLSTSLWSAGPQPANSTTAPAQSLQVAFHSLRIGIKRFRYIVENFFLSSTKPGATTQGIQTYSASPRSRLLWPLPFPARFFPMQIRAPLAGSNPLRA